jgi:hypothetical protein
MLPVPAANKFFQLHIFKLNAKKNWRNIKIFKFYLVVRQLGEKKILRTFVTEFCDILTNS